MNKKLFLSAIALSLLSVPAIAATDVNDSSMAAPSSMDDEDSMPVAPHSHPMIPAESAAETEDEDAGTTPQSPAPFTASTEKNAPVISGGVGEEMDHLKSIQNQYSLKLLITEANGIFLSNVAVNIRDKEGRSVADIVTEGPVVLANLPSGNYKVTARRHDEVKEFNVSVKSGKLRAYQVAFNTTDERASGDAHTTPLQ